MFNRCPFLTGLFFLICFLSPSFSHWVPASLRPVWYLRVADDMRLSHTQLTVEPLKLPAPGKKQFLYIFEALGHGRAQRALPVYSWRRLSEEPAESCQVGPRRHISGQECVLITTYFCLFLNGEVGDCRRGWALSRSSCEKERCRLFFH